MLLDNCYLQGVDTKRQVHEWKEFLGRLGVTDFLAVRQKKLILKKSELVRILLNLDMYGLCAGCR